MDSLSIRVLCSGAPKWLRDSRKAVNSQKEGSPMSVGAFFAGVAELVAAPLARGPTRIPTSYGVLGWLRTRHSGNSRTLNRAPSKEHSIWPSPCIHLHSFRVQLEPPFTPKLPRLGPPHADAYTSDLQENSERHPFRQCGAEDERPDHQVREAPDKWARRILNSRRGQSPPQLVL